MRVYQLGRTLSRQVRIAPGSGQRAWGERAYVV